jgi:ribosomal protein S6
MNGIAPWVYSYITSKNQNPDLAKIGKETTMIDENTIPVWCEPTRRPAVEVRCSDYRYLNSSSLVYELNKLFEGHVEFQNCVAEIKYVKEFRCKLCGNICEILHNNETHERTCNICGKGKLEYAIKKMAESEGTGTL